MNSLILSRVKTSGACILRSHFFDFFWNDCKISLMLSSIHPLKFYDKIACNHALFEDDSSADSTVVVEEDWFSNDVTDQYSFSLLLLIHHQLLL